MPFPDHFVVVLRERGEREKDEKEGRGSKLHRFEFLTEIRQALPNIDCLQSRHLVSVTLLLVLLEQSRDSFEREKEPKSDRNLISHLAFSSFAAPSLSLFSTKSGTYFTPFPNSSNSRDSPRYH